MSAICKPRAACTTSSLYFRFFYLANAKNECNTTEIKMGSLSMTLIGFSAHGTFLVRFIGKQRRCLVSLSVFLLEIQFRLTICVKNAKQAWSSSNRLLGGEGQSYCRIFGACPSCFWCEQNKKSPLREIWFKNNRNNPRQLLRARTWRLWTVCLVCAQLYAQLQCCLNSRPVPVSFVMVIYI